MSRCIDADELMELLTTAIWNMEGIARLIGVEDDPEIKMKIKTYTDIANWVKDAPTIEPERKTGKWINANDGKWNTVEVLKCSVCGEIDNRMYRTDNFCPNCGAKMEGEDDGTD